MYAHQYLFTVVRTSFKCAPLNSMSGIAAVCGLESWVHRGPPMWYWPHQTLLSSHSLPVRHPSSSIISIDHPCFLPRVKSSVSSGDLVSDVRLTSTDVVLRWQLSKICLHGGPSDASELRTTVWKGFTYRLSGSSTRGKDLRSRRHLVPSPQKYSLPLYYRAQLHSLVEAVSQICIDQLPITLHSSHPDSTLTCVYCSVIYPREHHVIWTCGPHCMLRSCKSLISRLSGFRVACCDSPCICELVSDYFGSTTYNDFSLFICIDEHVPWSKTKMLIEILERIKRTKSQQ
jgi:hypothetical protein